MAPPKAEMKDYFKKKKAGGISKSSAKAKPSPTVSKKTTPKNSTKAGSDITQSPALVSHGSPYLQDAYDEKEEMLRLFDMNMAYGPCIGMDRLDRWKRAKAWGLNPPIEVAGFLNSGGVQVASIWDGRI